MSFLLLKKQKYLTEASIFECSTTRIKWYSSTCPSLTKPCPTCTRNGVYHEQEPHSTTRSSRCPYHELTTEQYIVSEVGQNYRRFVKKDRLRKLHIIGRTTKTRVFKNRKRSRQKRCILSLDKKYDPTIQLLYQIAKEKFEDECLVEEEKLAIIQDLCYKGKTQFRKIIDCLENNEPTEKIMQHALNGECFFMHQARKFDEKQREVNPIEDTPDVSSLTTTMYHNNSLTMDNNTFVENLIANKTRGMSWKRCYEEGKAKGFFSNYMYITYDLETSF